MHEIIAKRGLSCIPNETIHGKSTHSVNYTILTQHEYQFLHLVYKGKKNNISRTELITLIRSKFNQRK